MIIETKIDKDGGFYAMNQITQHVEYAYPTSHYARLAKRNPAAAARQMMEGEIFVRTLPNYREHNQHLLLQMRAA